MKRTFIIPVLFLLWVLTAAGQDIAVRALLDTNRALIGDQIKLELIVEQPNNTWQVMFPQVKDSLTSDIEVVKKSDIDTARTAEGLTLSQELLITVFDTGFFEIPALPFRVKSDALSDTIKTLPVAFEMLSVKADSTIRDIHGVYRMPLSFREILPWILVLIGVWLLIWFILHLLKNRKIKDTGHASRVHTEPPEVIAIRELEKLKKEKPWLNSRVKFYYIRISEILRTYLEDRYQIQAMEQTTDEIISSLKPMHPGEEDYNNLISMLRLSDLVKFAKVIPDTEENASQVDKAIQFVNRTKRESGIPDNDLPGDHEGNPGPERKADASGSLNNTNKDQ